MIETSFIADSTVRSAKRRYLSYSGRLWFFRPAGARRCTDWVKFGTMQNFTHIGAKVYDPKTENFADIFPNFGI